MHAGMNLDQSQWAGDHRIQGDRQVRLYGTLMVWPLGDGDKCGVGCQGHQANVASRCVEWQATRTWFQYTFWDKIQLCS